MQNALKLDKSLIVFDVETTGTEADISSIIQLGAVKLDRDMNLVYEKFIANIKPYRNFWSKEAEKVHGISFQTAIEYGIEIKDALERFEFFVGNPKNSYLAQWSCGFDTAMLKSAYNFCNKEYPFSYRAYDLASICRFYVARHGFSSKYGCFKIAEFLNIDTTGLQAHNALSDALVSAKCLQSVANNVLEKKND